MAGIKFDMTGDNRNVLEAFKGVQQGVRLTQNVVERSGQSIESMFTRIQNAMSAGIMGLSAMGLGKQIMTIRGEFQQLEVAFNTMLGDEIKASALMNQLVNTAAKTPFDLKGVADGAKSLMAYGIAAEDVNDTLIHLGDIAAGLSIPLGDLVYLYGTTMVQGRMFTQDLRQFQGRGIPIAEEIAKIMGVTKEAVGELVTAGKVTKEVFSQAITNMTSEGSKFGGLMDAQSKTIAGQISNIEDAVDMMFNDIGKQSEGVINEGLGAVSSLIEHYKEIGEVVLRAVAAFGAYKAALMVMVAATNSYQKLNFGKQMEILNAEIDALVPSQQASANADLEQAVAKGKLTAAQAEEIANRRELLSQMQQGKMASGMTGELDAQISQARELLGIKEESANADLDEMVAKGQLNEAQAREIASKRESLATLSEELEKRREAAQSALEAAFDEKEAAQQNYEMLSGYADAAEEAYSAALDLGDAEEIEAAREKMLTAYEAQNTAERRLNAAATQLETAQKEADSLATTANTAATSANTTSEVANTEATGANTLTQKMHALSAKAGALAESILTAAIKGTTAALNSMKEAIMTNPIGVLIGAVSIAWPLISKLTSKTDDFAEVQKRFDETTTKATANVKALYATLGTASKTSKVSIDTAKELKQIAEEYGVALSEEAKKTGNEAKLVEELIGKREELIDAIRREAIERERANQQKAIEDSYAAMIQEARDKFVNSLSDDFSTQAKGIMSQLITDDDLERIGRAEAEVRRMREIYGKYSVEVANAERERAAMTDELVKKLWNYSAQLGKIEGDETKYAAAASNMKDALIDFIRTTNDSTVAQENAKIALAQSTLATIEQIKVQDAAKASVETLSSITSSLITLWNSENHMTLKIHYDDSEIPKWMSGLTDEQLAKSLAARQNAVRGNKKVHYGNRVLGNDEQTIKEMGMLQSEQERRASAKNKPTPTVTTTEKPKKIRRTKAENEAQRKAAEAAQKRQELYDAELRSAEDSASQEIATREAIEKERIAKIQSDGERSREEEQHQHELNLRDIEERAKEMKKKRVDALRDEWEAKNTDKSKVWADTKAAQDVRRNGYANITLSKNEQAQISAETAEENARWHRILEDREKAERESLRNFLKEYGDYEEQKLAITKEYEEKIKDADSIGERLKLQKEMEKKLSDLQMAEFDQSINWEVVFNGLDNVSMEHLRRLKESLRDALDTKEITAEQAKVISERINAIDEQMIAKSKEWQSAFGLIIPELEKIRMLEREAAAAEERLADAEERYLDSLEEVAATRREILALLKQEGIEIDEKDVTAGNAEMHIGYMNMQQHDPSGVTNLTKLYEKLGKQESTLAENTEALTSAQGEAGMAAEQAGGSFATTVAVIDKVIHTINDNVQSAVELFDQMGISDTKFGKGFSSFAESSKYATEAWENLKSGNIMGVANGVYGSLRTLGDALGKWGISGMGSSDVNLHEDIERLTYSNQSLNKAIDALADELSDASVLDVREIYETQKSYLEQSEKNTLEMMKRSAEAYSNGFLGIGGKHSSQYEINAGVTAEEWGRVSQIVGRTISSAGDFFTLSSREMYEVMMNANDVFSHVMSLADDGAENAAQFMMEYVEYWKKAEDLENQAIEKITGTSFDSLKDSFRSALTDMHSSAKDFAKNFEDMMFEAIVNAFILDSDFDKWMEDWMKRYSEALQIKSDSTRNAALKDLEKEYTQKRDELVAERGMYASAMGYTGSAYEQSASSKGWQSMGQETADELNGRFTALQIAGEGIWRNTDIIIATLQSMQDLCIGNGGVLATIRDMMITSNSYLEDIARYNKSIYTDFSEKMDKMNRQTEDIYNAIRRA